MPRYPTEHQVIVIGPQDQIEAEVSRAGEEVIGRSPQRLGGRTQTLDFAGPSLEVITQALRRLHPENGDPFEGIPFFSELAARWSPDVPWVMALYGMPSPESTRDLALEINRGDVASAQRNVVTGHGEESWGGGPWRGPDEMPDRSKFDNQWAFGPAGLDFPEAVPWKKDASGDWVRDADGKRVGAYHDRCWTGHRVRVGVFDSSPFPAEGVQLIDRVDPPLSLMVSHPKVKKLSPDSPLPAHFRPHPNHGLLVAGLVHAVAPRSQIRLIRVLDEYVRGHAGALIWPLWHFIFQFCLDWVQGEIAGAVVNLSLGMSLDPTKCNMRELRIVNGLLKLACRLRFVVVASAGNDSYAEWPPRPAQIPASYGNVIGVEASDISRTRACFSNKGNVAAPGCGLISLFEKPPSSSPKHKYWTGFDYCMGTSFAAPLVSGLAALVLHKNRLVPPPAGKTVIEQIVEDGTGPAVAGSGLDNGIIDVPKTLL
jgi:hypothetical protein